MDIEFRFANVAKLAALLDKHISFYDLETTTLRGMPNFGIMEIGVVVVTKQGPAITLNEFINPECPISEEAEKLTGITSSLVAGKENWGAKFAGLMVDLSKETWVSGFNIASFDNPSVRDMNTKFGIEEPSFDRMFDMRPLYLFLTSSPSLKGKLGEIAKSMGLARKGHRALNDVIMCVELLDTLIEVYGLEKVHEYIVSDKRPKLMNALNVSKYAVHVYAKTEKPVTYAQISKRFQKEVSDCMYEISCAIDERLINPDVFADVSIQVALEAALNKLPSSILGSGRLKPVFDEIKQNNPEIALDWVQLRIALLRKNVSWASLKQD